MYIESSAPRKLGDNAVFVSPSFRPGKDRCMTFWLVRILLQPILADVMRWICEL